MSSLVVTPTRASGTPAIKRRITPSPGMCPKRVLILATPEKPREDENAIWHSRHVLLPFDLRDPSVNIDCEGEVRDLLLNVFPGTYNVAEARSHLVFQVDQLPSGPWPLTVGRVPITLVTEDGGRALIFPRKLHGNPRLSICEEWHDVIQSSAAQLSDADLRRLAVDVNTYFEKNIPGVRVLEVMLTCERTIYLFLDDHISLTAVRPMVPGKIAKCFVGYFNERELCRPPWNELPAKRVIQQQPVIGVVDDTAYDVLRPGVVIRSKMLRDDAYPGVWSTTSGVLVKNAVGDTFMTAASHGIGQGQMVWQGDRSDRPIGEAVVEISFTDVSLLKLKPDVPFVNETFETVAGTVPEFTRLRTSEDRLPFSLCHLNSPFTGNMDATMVSRSVRLFRSSSHPTESNLNYDIYDWMWTGQEEGNEGKVRPPNGTSGSVIWNEEGIILGFYHYHIAEGPWAGFAASASAGAVVDAGYQLAK